MGSPLSESGLATYAVIGSPLWADAMLSGLFSCTVMGISAAAAAMAPANPAATRTYLTLLFRLAAGKRNTVVLSIECWFISFLRPSVGLSNPEFPPSLRPISRSPFRQRKFLRIIILVPH